MENRKNFFLIGILALLVFLAASVTWHYASLKYENNILTDFDRFFESGDNLKARGKARELGFFDGTAESFYLANLNISDSLTNPSDSNKLYLAAAAYLDNKSSFRNKIFKSDFFY